MKTASTPTRIRRSMSPFATIAVFAAVGFAGAISGCASDGERGVAARDDRFEPKQVDPAADEAMMSRIQGLQGEWESQDADGNWNIASVFSVSSNGSVVREIMFPGEPHEMTNVYHMDGARAVVTHYCAIGNQPRMVASGVTQTDDGPAIEYGFDSVSNFRAEQGSIMGTLRVVFIDDDHIRQDWISMNAKGEAANEMSFNLRRKP